MAPADMSLLVGTWELTKAATITAPIHESLAESTEESVLSPDFRSMVDEADYKDGGKYRSIVKLQMQYERNKDAWFMGTGWLIRPDLMITAGHNVYNWSGKLGKAEVIKCHIGYYGKESVGKPGVQSRLAKRVITTAGWLASKDNRDHDLAFIQVDKPFEGNLRVFSYDRTPGSGYEMLGVVGYPGDMRIKDSYGRDENGARMYEQFCPVQYDIMGVANEDNLKLLKYPISTFGGQSGAPVIRKGTQTGIATHVYGYGLLNAASPIGSEYGNDYDSFLKAFNQDFPAAGDIEGIPVVKVPGLGVPAAGAPLTDSNLATFNTSGTVAGQAANAEGFFDILSTVGKIATSIGPTIISSALMGPLGAPVSAIAGAAISALGKSFAESASDGGPADKLGADDGATERAIIAEAALQAVVALRDAQPDHPTVKNLELNMSNTYTALVPNLKPIAATLAPALMGSAAKIAVFDNYIPKNKIPRITSAPRTLPNTMLRAEAGSESNDFVECMFGPTPLVQGEEAWYDGIARVVSKGLEYGKPVAKWGLSQLSKALAEAGAEEAAGDDTDVAAAELVAKRAVMAEAALQAVMKLSKGELTGVKIKDPLAVQEESFLSFIQTGAQKLYSVVKDNAPAVISKVAPIVLKAISNKIAPGAESSFMSREAALSAPPSTPAKGLRASQSRINLIGGVHTNKFGAVPVSALLHSDFTVSDIKKARRKSTGSDSNEDLPVREIMY